MLWDFFRLVASLFRLPNGHHHGLTSAFVHIPIMQVVKGEKKRKRMKHQRERGKRKEEDHNFLATSEGR